MSLQLKSTVFHLQTKAGSPWVEVRVPQQEEHVEICVLDPKGIKEMFRPPAKRDEVCSACGGAGYRGRTGVFEMFTVNDKIRDMIRDKSSLREFKLEARRTGIEYLQEYGLRLVAQGKTSIQELMRVVQ